MYLVLPDPAIFPFTQDTVMTARPDNLQRVIDHSSIKFPGASIHVYKMVEMLKIEVPAVMRKYIVNDSGEVLPE